ncbi:hypothetical protein [Aquirufa nivalisilvae]|uniref:hypothetical protein n=1 Tax=Aquirufa nivalisilvae TaxID=2516557 RepID=UPI0022A9D4E8|nr:hypothetical protein [Aquirufa nivalisilvae]MCZ2479733.1 hypothetical protein [Aquirufa nivalisilvae]
MKNGLLLLGSILLFGSTTLLSQQSAPPPAPTPVEVMFGNNRMNFQLILNKPIDAQGKFSFFNVTNGAVDYHNKNEETEIVVVNTINYDLGNNFKASAGAQWHFKLGLVPLVGVQYFKANPTWLLLVSPNICLLPTTNMEVVSLVEFKPSLNPKTRLYTRGQLLYNQVLDGGIHARSGYTFRAGISRQKFTYGIGMNFDYYGPFKAEKLNTGVFVRISL